jgi:hypothetical protein
MATYIIGGSTITEDTGNVASAGNINVVNSANSYQIAGTSIFAIANTWTNSQSIGSDSISGTKLIVTSVGTGNAGGQGYIQLGGAFFSQPSYIQTITPNGTKVVMTISTGYSSLSALNEMDMVVGTSNIVQLFATSMTINGSLVITKNVTTYNNITTKGFGVPAIYGLDNRTGITAVDASAITLYTTTAAGQLYRINARAFATAGTSATYVVKWTEGGVANSQTLSVTALDTEVSANFLVQPDASTAITAQITAITSTTLNVATTVEQLA